MPLTTDKYVVNSDETLAAREKLGLIKERFALWAFDDAALASMGAPQQTATVL